jgi:hypothetical protein
MGNERNPEVEQKDLKRPEEQGRPPNPAEDLSMHGKKDEPVVFGPDGSGEAPETDNEMQYGRGAD